MSPESTHKLMGFYVEDLILGVILYLVHGFCFFKLFPIGCIGLKGNNVEVKTARSL